jgi:hypothetical protein
VEISKDGDIMPEKLIHFFASRWGINPCGMAAVILGLVVCVVLGLTMRQKVEG